MTVAEKLKTLLEAAVPCDCAGLCEHAEAVSRLQSLVQSLARDWLTQHEALRVIEHLALQIECKDSVAIWNQVQDALDHSELEQAMEETKG